MKVSKTFGAPYAKALFRLAQDTKDTAAWRTRLSALSEVFQERRFVYALEKMPPAEALRWLTSISKDLFDEKSLSLLFLLLQNKRLSSLPDIFGQFENLLTESEGYGVLNLTSAVKLTEEHKAKAVELMERVFQKKLRVHTHVDPLLRGGIVGRVGDLVYDGSVKGSLEKLREVLIP